MSGGRGPFVTGKGASGAELILDAQSKGRHASEVGKNKTFVVKLLSLFPGSYFSRQSSWPFCCVFPNLAP